MEALFEIDPSLQTFDSAFQKRATEALEDEHIVYMPRRTFELSADERRLFMDPEVVDQPRKHTGRARIIYEPDIGKLRCSNLEGNEQEALRAMLARYAKWSHELVLSLFPTYEPGLDLGPTTFRPCPRTGPQGLHVDSFFFVPTEGKRVLRIFTNVNPENKPREWQVGRERFEPFAQRLMPQVKRPIPGSGWMLDKFHITKGKRTAYDHTMRQLRNLTKRDKTYQSEAPRDHFAFPSGSTWVVFPDNVLHGALTGQFAFEQTFLLDVDAMLDPARSPLRTLERLAGRALA